MNRKLESGMKKYSKPIKRTRNSTAWARLLLVEYDVKNNKEPPKSTLTSNANHDG
jgi:hypothetical protein